MKLLEDLRFSERHNIPFLCLGEHQGYKFSNFDLMMVLVYIKILKEMEQGIEIELERRLG